MSQVKNLRAMFESKGDTSPPDRGRSPGVSSSTSGPNGTASSRPLSKVRTHFVAIEKDGRMGLRRDRSDESSLSGRRMSIETDVASASTLPDKPAMPSSSDDLASPTRRPFGGEPIPKSTSQPVDVNRPSQDAGAVSDKPSTNPDKQVDEEQSSGVLIPTNPAAKSSSEAPKAETRPLSSARRRKGDDSQVDGASAAPSNASAPPPKKSTVTSTVSANPAARAPTTLRSFNGTSKRDDANKFAMKASEKPRAKRDTPARVRTTTVAARSRPLSSSTTASDAGFVRPKPKSPTKPDSLPDSLTAPTASSVSKGGAVRRPLSRQSGSLRTLNAPSPSIRATLSTPSASAQQAKGQGTAAGRPRPSVGRPPSKPLQPNTSAAKRQSHVDESFLVRMMRPTQSSSSKTSEKAPPTPPKKIAPRPSTAGTDRSLRQDASTRKTGVAKDTAIRKSPAICLQEPQAARTRESFQHELVETETRETDTSFAQDGGECRAPVIPGDPDSALGPELAGNTTPEPAQSETVEEATATVQDTTSAPEPTKEAVALVQGTDLVQEASVKPTHAKLFLDPTPKEEPAPEADHTEATEERADSSHNDVSHSTTPPKDPTTGVKIFKPVKNTQGNMGDGVGEVDDYRAKPTGMSSEAEAAVVSEGERDEPVPSHESTRETEGQPKLADSDSDQPIELRQEIEQE